MPRDGHPGLLVIALFLIGTSAVARQVTPELMSRDANLAQLAAEAAARGPATPYPLLGDTDRPLGAIYDQYVLGVLAARQEIAAGRSGDVTAIAAHPLWRSRNIVVVAYPIDCEGRPNRPLAIRWTMSRPLPIAPQSVGEPVRGSGAQAVLPGVGLPADALVVALRNLPLIGASVEIDFASPVCQGAARTARLPVSASPSLGFVTGFTANKLPEALSALPSPTTVHVRTTLDAAGRARFSEAVSGPPELARVALELVGSRTFPPATTNGVPSPFNVVVPVVFTVTGERATPEPYRPALSAGPNTRTTTSTLTMSVPSRPTTPPPVAPPAPPGLLESQLARLAIEVAQRGDPVPVPFDAAGPARHGVIFDRFLVAAVKARAAIAAGTALDPTTASPELLREDAVAVAFPLACDGRTIAPSDIALSTGGTRPGPIRETGSVLRGEALRERLPGVHLPDGAVGKPFASAPFSQGVEVRVTYAEPPCGSESNARTLPIQWVRGTSIRRPAFARLPPDTTLPSPMAVQLRGLVDVDGVYRFPTLADGPAELAVTATTLAAGWRFQPYRANGVPSPQGVLASLTFTTSGGPEAAMPPGLNPPAPPAAGAPPPLVTSVRGGPGEITTPEVSGLSATTSQCAIATTSTYGFSPSAPIKTGGGPVVGPARERQFLALLRGPSGEGLRIIRLGSTMAPDGETLLDLYEITYSGLAAPVRLYLDEYHDGTLQAPQGFVCAAPIAIR